MRAVARAADLAGLERVVVGSRDDRTEQAETFERCMSVGGVAVFPADTVYGLACDAGNTGDVIRRLYALKRRPLSKPSAVMFFDLETALTVLPELGRADPGGAGAAAARARSRCCCPTPSGASRWPAARTRRRSGSGSRSCRRWPASAGRCCSRARTWPVAPRRARWTRCPSGCAPRPTW